jgi:adenylate cyclase
MFLTRLKTVRQKLTALVGLSVVVMLATLPVLSWLLHRQLVDEVDDRVVEAELAFQTELDDDLADLTLASRVTAADSDTARALLAHDAALAKKVGGVFLSVYPNMDLLFVQGDGAVLAQLGCQHPPEHIGGIAEIKDVLKGQEIHGVVDRGCESADPSAPPAYVIATPIRDGANLAGAVIVCLPIDKEYLKNASAKLGLELGFAVLGQNNEHVLDATPRFPIQKIPLVNAGETTILDSASTTWAVARFQPRQLTGPHGQLTMAAALDVTDIGTIVRSNLVRAILVLGFAALVSVFVGWRLAALMSSAIGRVNAALIKVKNLEYVHVDAVHTGDELEDLANGFNVMVDGLKVAVKQREMLGKYMTASVVDHLLGGKWELGGTTLPVTILFTDIRSFTSISEKMDAQSLVGLLNEYFTDMVGIVMDEEGVVDKYIGDAIMAVFGAPVPKKDDALRAVRAAVRMRQALVRLNERLGKRGIASLRTGIGIHTGEVVAGNIGSERRMEYTVIGDPVNVASRLESCTKELGVNVLISEDTYRLTQDAIVARAVKELTVKGRQQPVMAYEVLGLAGEPALEKTSTPDLKKAAG